MTLLSRLTHGILTIVLWFAVLDLAAITVIQSAKYITKYW